jgi:hypothetical protein
MPDQIIDAVMARSIHIDAVRAHPLAAWVIARDQIDYPGKLVARLVTDAPTSYVLLFDTLAGLQAQLPVATCKHPGSGSQTSDRPAHDHCKWPWDTNPESLQLNPD